MSEKIKCYRVLLRNFMGDYMISPGTFKDKNSYLKYLDRSNKMIENETGGLSMPRPEFVRLLTEIPELIEEWDKDIYEQIVEGD